MKKSKGTPNRCTLPPMVARRSTMSPATSSKAGQWYLNPRSMAEIKRERNGRLLKGVTWGWTGTTCLYVCIVGICMYIHVYIVCIFTCMLSLSHSLSLSVNLYISNDICPPNHYLSWGLCIAKLWYLQYKSNAICSHNVWIFMLPVRYQDASCSYWKDCRKFIGFQLQQHWI